MHVWTHLKQESQGKTGLGVYPDGMVEHDGHVGELLDKLDAAGHRRQHHRDVLDRQRRRGTELARWRQSRRSAARRTPNWEGGWRVPCAIRWPGVIKPGTVSNEIFSHQDMLPDARGGGRRSGHRREMQEGLQGRQQDLQGSS